MKNFISILFVLVMSASLSFAQTDIEDLYQSKNKFGRLSNLPDGNPKDIPTYYCSGFYVKTLFSRSLGAREQAKAIQQWADSCMKKFNNNYAPGDLTVLLDYVMMNTMMNSNKLVNPISYKTKDGRTVKGLMGFHKDGKKRPLVIGRCGVYCAGMSGSTANSFVSHFFEESHYNVIMLESMTSTDYTIENKTISVSGFDEAGQMFELSQNLDLISSELKRNTSEVNFVGYSLGGHAALFTSLISSLNKTNIPIKSVLSFCPVVDLEKQMDFLFKNRNIRGEIVTLFNKFLLRSINRLFPVFSDEELTNISFDNDGMKKVVSVNNLRFYQRHTENLSFSKMNPYKGVQIKEFDDLWRLSRWQDFAKDVKTPTFVMGSGDDAVVSFPINTGIIDRNAAKDLGVVRFDGGNHCAFAMYNGWGAASGLLTGFLDAHSSYKPTMAELPLENLDVISMDLREVKDTKEVYSYTWHVNNPGKYAIATVYRARPFSLCMKKWKLDCKEDDLTPYYMRIPLTSLAAAGLPAEIKDKATAALVSRYLNANAQLLGPNGQDWRIDPGQMSAVKIPVRQSVLDFN